ncbi:MAG: polysaccharide deacetylase family protein [Candidatus Dojkabacteria bacterium]
MVIQKLNIKLEEKNKVELLRYGQTEIKNNGLDYDFILQNADPLLLNSQMLYIYLNYREKEISNFAVQEELLPSFRNLLKTVQNKLQLYSLISIFPKESIDKLAEATSQSLELLKDNKYLEAIEKINKLGDNEQEIFLKILSKHKLEKKYEDISRISRIFSVPLILDNTNTLDETSDYLNDYSFTNESGEEITSIIYVESNTKILSLFLDDISKKEKSLTTKSSLFLKFESLKREIEEIQMYISNQENGKALDDTIVRNIVNTLSSISFNNNENIRILFYTIQINKQSLLTISPYVSKQDTSIENNNFDTEYDVKPTFQSSGSVRIPVLMYHQIANAPKGSSQFKQGLYVSPEIFEEQIAYLTRKNYKTVSSKEFDEILTTGKNPSQKTVMLTFDDANPTHYAKAYPILKKYGQTGVFFIPSAKSSISFNQLEEMALNGMSIDSHSATHPDLVKLTNHTKLVSEIAGSKSALQARTGKQVYAIAYPGCVADTKVFNIVASSGYKLGFSCGKWVDHYPRNRYSISRVHVFNDMKSFVRILSGIN